MAIPRTAEHTGSTENVMSINNDNIRLNEVNIPQSRIVLPTGEDVSLEEALEKYKDNIPAQMQILASLAVHIPRDEEGHVKEERQEESAYIRQLALRCFENFSPPRRRQEIVRLLSYDKSYRNALIALGVNVNAISPLGQTYLERGNAHQQRVVIRNNSFTGRNDVIRALAEKFNKESVGKVKRVVEFMGGAKYSGVDAQYMQEFEGFIERLHGKYEGEETFVVLPATNSGPFYPVVFDKAIQKQAKTASVVPHGVVVLPFLTSPSQYANKSENDWYDETFGVLPTDYVMDVLPGTSFGDELVLMIEHAISLAIMSHSPNCERIGVLADGGGISVDEASRFLRNFEYSPNSYFVILKDAGRLSTFLGIMLENPGIVDKRGILDQLRRECDSETLPVLEKALNALLKNDEMSRKFFDLVNNLRYYHRNTDRIIVTTVSESPFSQQETDKK